MVPLILGNPHMYTHTSHPVLVTIKDNEDYIGVLYIPNAYNTTITGWGGSSSHTYMYIYIYV